MTHPQNKELFPQYILGHKHNDYLPGLRWVPREWTSYTYPMPPVLLDGNVGHDWFPVQEGYPLRKDVILKEMPAKIWSEKFGNPVLLHMWAPGNCDAPGKWRVLAKPWDDEKAGFWEHRGRWFYQNVGWKPDYLYDYNDPWKERENTGSRNWIWSFPEASLTRA